MTGGNAAAEGKGRTGDAPAIVSVAEIRAQFPALKRHFGGRAIAYFDGPGGTQVPRSVPDAMSDYLLRHNANTHWLYPTSEETDAIIEYGREALADFLGATSAEIAFGANMTTLTYHLSRALGRAWKAGDEIVVTDLDHHANIDPWRALARERGVTIRAVPFDAHTGQLEWSALEDAINSRTRLVAIGAASNALGTISDVARACAMTREAGALSFVDAVHYAPHALVDVRAMGCDFLACSPYKFYGPHLGVLFGRRDLVESLDVPKLAPSPDNSPDRLETGTGNHEGIAGAAAAVNFLASLATGRTRRQQLASAFAALHDRARVQIERLWSGLGELPGVRLYGPPPGEPRTPTIGFTVQGYSTDDVARSLAARGIFASNGDFYAATVIERLGLAPDGLVRAGCACYTTDEETDALVQAVAMLTTTSAASAGAAAGA